MNYDFDVLVIGGGAAGLTAAGLAASLGAKTLLIERQKTGGDCTWNGCVPSKALLNAARHVHQLRSEPKMGIRLNGDVSIDFAEVMKYVRGRSEEIYAESDAPDVLNDHNIEVLSGEARFVNAHAVEVAEPGNSPKTISSKYIVICTGARPLVPEVEGASLEGVYTNETIFSITEQPERLAIVGAGPVGIEMAQAFARLGTAVTVVDQTESILSRGEPECSELVRRRLEREGVIFLLESTLESVSRCEGHLAVQIDGIEGNRTLEVDALLLASGRSPDVDGLDLDVAGVRHDETGIDINHSCQTSTPYIYACGDVAKGLDFTHVAEEMARTAIKRLLLKIPSTYSRIAVPSITFTDPESASIGCTSVELDRRKVSYSTIRFPFARIDRGRIEMNTEGVIVIHHSPTKGKILGAHIVGERAGELIHEFALAMRNDLTLREISATLHAYPSWSLGLRRSADQIYVRTATPGPLKFVGSLFGYRGEVSPLIGTDEII